MSRQPLDPELWDRHCTTLGVDIEFTAQELRSAYKRQCLKSHPDKNPGREAEAEREFKELQHAYAYLIDPANIHGGASGDKGDYFNDPNFFYDEEFFGDVFFNFFASRSSWGSDGRGCNCIHCRTTHMAFLQRTCCKCGKQGEHQLKCDTCATYWCSEACRVSSTHKAPRDCESLKEKARESFIPENLRKNGGKSKKKKKKKKNSNKMSSVPFTSPNNGHGSLPHATVTPRAANDFIGALDFLDAIKEDYHGQNLFQQLEMLVWTLDDQHFNEYGELCDEEGLGRAMSSHLKVFLAEYPLIAQQYNRFVMPQYQIPLSAAAIRAAQERQAEIARMRAEEARRQLQEAQRKAMEQAQRRRNKKKAKRAARALARAEDRRAKEEEREQRVQSQIATLVHEMPSADPEVVRDCLEHCNGSTKGARKIVALTLEFPLLTVDVIKKAMQKAAGNSQQAKKVLGEAQRKEKRHHAERERINHSNMVNETVAKLSKKFPMIDQGEIKKCIEPMLPGADEEQLSSALQPLVAHFEKLQEERRQREAKKKAKEQQAQAAKQDELCQTLLSLFSSLTESDVRSLMKKHSNSADAAGAAAMQLDQKRKRAKLKRTIEKACKRFPKMERKQIERTANDLAGDWGGTVAALQKMENAKLKNSSNLSRKQKKRQRKLQMQKEMEEKARREEIERAKKEEEENRRLLEQQQKKNAEEEARRQIQQRIAEEEKQRRREEEKQKKEQEEEEERQRLEAAAAATVAANAAAAALAATPNVTTGVPVSLSVAPGGVEATGDDGVYSWLSQAGLGDIANVVMQQANVSTLQQLNTFAFNDLSLFALAPEQRERLQSALARAGLSEPPILSPATAAGTAGAVPGSSAAAAAGGGGGGAPANMMQWVAPSESAFANGWLSQMSGTSSVPTKRPLWTSTLPTVNAFPSFTPDSAGSSTGGYSNSPPEWWASTESTFGIIPSSNEETTTTTASSTATPPITNEYSVAAAQTADPVGVMLLPDVVPSITPASATAPISSPKTNFEMDPPHKANPRRPMCDLWLRKECKMSAKCPKLHDRPCRFASTGRECSFGNNCSFLHAGDPGFRLSKRFESKMAHNEKLHRAQAAEAQQQLLQSGGEGRLSDFGSSDLFPPDQFLISGGGSRARVRLLKPNQTQRCALRARVCPSFDARTLNGCEWGDSCPMAHSVPEDAQQLHSVQVALQSKNTFLGGVKTLHRLVMARQRHVSLQQLMELLSRIGELIGPKMRFNCLKLVSEILRTVAADDIPDSYQRKVAMFQRQCEEATIARNQKQNNKN